MLSLARRENETLHFYTFRWLDRCYRQGHKG